MCPHTTMYVCSNRHVDNSMSIGRHLSNSIFKHAAELCMCPHTTMYVCTDIIACLRRTYCRDMCVSYCRDMCVPILLYI